MNTPRRDTSLLAVQPTSRGFGFVLFERWLALVDWGSCTARTDRNARCVHHVATLLAHYHPDILVTEDPDAPACRRHPRIRNLLHRMHRSASDRGFATAAIGRSDLVDAFARLGDRNKDQIAATVADLVPDLAHRLPPPRRVGHSQDERLGIFDAAALALAYHAGAPSRRRPLSTNPHPHGTPHPRA